MPQGHALVVLGCDFATGGDGEGGDDNVIIDRQGRAAGRNIYHRFNDKNTVSVASILGSAIDRIKPDMTFIDTGGGAQVYDILGARGYRQMTLVDFGAKPLDGRKYLNKRAEMWGDMRDWLGDVGGSDIPDEDTLDGELTGAEGKDGLSSARAAGEEGSGAKGNRPQSGRRRRARDHVCRNGARAKSIGHARAGDGDC